MNTSSFAARAYSGPPAKAHGILSAHVCRHTRLYSYHHIQNLTVIKTGGGSDAIATTSTLGSIIVGENLKITPAGVLSVDMAENISGDNTKPVSAAKVYTEIGNINVLLGTI